MSREPASWPLAFVDAQTDHAPTEHAAALTVALAARAVTVHRVGQTDATGAAEGSGDTALLGVGAGDAAVRIATSSRHVAALVLVDAALSQDSVELLGEAVGLPVLTVVDTARRDVLASAVDGHLASAHERSDLVPGPAADVGTRAGAIAAWLTSTRRALGEHSSCTFPSRDGWILHADLTVPHRDHPVPAVVLAHSGRSDRSIYARLARLLVARGVAALCLDYRGRGESSAPTRFVDMTSQQQAAAALDVAAGLDLLAAHPAVDGARLGALGIAHGAGYAAAGCLDDPRVRALVLLTGFNSGDERLRSWLTSGVVDVLYVSGTPHRVTTSAMRELHAQTRGSRSRFIELPEGVLGYQLFDLHPDLEPTIADWFQEVLTR